MSKRKRILTWAPNWAKRGKPGGRWKKQINGKVHFFGSAKSEGDNRAYRAAERRYFEFLQKVEADQPVEIPLTDATVVDVCEQYLQSLCRRYDIGEISATHVEKTRCCLEDFAQHVGPTARFASIGGLALEDYRCHTLSRPVSEATGRQISLRYAKDRLCAVKAFFAWLYDMELLDATPRILRRYTRCDVPVIEVKTFTLAEVSELWAASNDRLRCWIALALNCGMGQTDLSDLRTGEVDLERSCIERQRSKTGVFAKHKLWHITLDLLAKHKRPDARDADRFFLTRDGNPLVARKIVNGHFHQNDAVRCAFWRVQERTGINSGRGFYCFRKTGATLIEQIDPLATEMYLSHAEPGMKRSYAERDWGRLERALAEMGSQLKDVLK